MRENLDTLAYAVLVGLVVGLLVMGPSARHVRLCPPAEAAR